MTVHFGQRDFPGPGRITCHQKRIPVQKKQACSNRCQAGEERASSYGPGRCHPSELTAKSVNATGGEIKQLTTCRKGCQRRNGARPSLRNDFGKPRSSGTTGRAISKSGGAIMSSKRCCAIWAESENWSKASSGD